jgi:xanthine dehydrogenase small subunit
LPHLIYIGQVAELRELKTTGDDLYIGAGVLLNDAFDALIKASDPNPSWNHSLRH